MSGRVAEGRLQVLQIYRLLQCVHGGDKEHIEKMVNLGVENLINLTEPRDGTGVLHVAVSANSQGDGPLLHSVRLDTFCLMRTCCSTGLLYQFDPFPNEVTLVANM